MNISCDNYRDKNGNYINFWANQARNDYAKLGVQQVFSKFNEEDMDEYRTTHYSLRNTINNELSPSERSSLLYSHTFYSGHVLKSGTKQSGHIVLNALKDLLSTKY